MEGWRIEDIEKRAELEAEETRRNGEREDKKSKQRKSKEKGQ